MRRFTQKKKLQVPKDDGENSFLLNGNNSEMARRLTQAKIVSSRSMGKYQHIIITGYLVIERGISENNKEIASYSVHTGQRKTEDS